MSIVQSKGSIGNLGSQEKSHSEMQIICGYYSKLMNNYDEKKIKRTA